MYRLIYFVVFIFIISACSKRSKEQKVLDGQLKISTKTKSIGIDENTVDYSKYTFFDNFNGQIYFSIFNDKEYRIQIYKWQSGQLLKYIPVQKEGPNGIGYLKGMKMLSLDSILIIPKRKDQFVILNDEGDILKKYNLPNQGLNSIDSWSKTQNQIDVVDGKLYFTQILQGNWNYVVSEDKVQTPLAAAYDPKEDSLFVFNTTFPVNYWEKGEIGMWFFRYYNDGLFYYTFPADHNLYTSSIKHDELISHNAKSNFISDNQLFSLKKPNSIEEIIKENVEYGRYLKLLYDSHREIFYRFVQLPREFEEGRDLSGQSRRIRSPFSVIVLDKNLNKVTEKKFPDRTYNQEITFVDEAGLWISYDHPYNEENKEDSFDFSLIKFE
ncbi:DUF4221 family protein [Marivirga sp.]|uniref:DUF4221 family protein n=1 Tax=Marivirga sp. TaxID=2018662 RepID=UPI0025E15489|nr:DUF4221 family protein [Marivirga sp.]